MMQKNTLQIHPGITENTLLGKRDIVCPKCKCPLCSYVLVSEKDFYFPPRHINVKDKLLNTIKQLIQEIFGFCFPKLLYCNKKSLMAFL